MNNQKLREEIKDGLIYGLIAGLIVGLMINFISQIIALISSNPEFMMFDFISSGILIIMIEVVGWLYVKRTKLNAKDGN